MQFNAVKERLVEKFNEHRMGVTVLAVTTMTTGLASAATLNDSIGPILDSVSALFVPLLNLIIGAVPLIIALAVIGFILGIFSAILTKLRI